MNLLENLPILLMGLSLMPIAHFLGRLFLFRARFDSFEWQGLVFQAFGFGVLSYLILILGTAGFLKTQVLWALYWILLGFSSLIIFEWWGWLANLTRLIQEGGVWSRLLFIASILYFLVLLIAALSPEIGNDSLCYHLGTAKAFLMRGRIDYDPYDVNSTFPFLLQLLFLFGIALKGALLAKFFHLTLGLYLLVAVFLLLRDSGVRTPLFWTFLFWLTPGFHQMTTAYTDLGLSAFSFLSIVFFFQAIEKRRLFYYGLSGIFLGFAFSVKVLAAMTLAGILAAGFGWIVLKRSRSDWNHFFAGVSLFLLSLLLACGFWYLRAYLLTGNPFFPYFGQFFGHDLIPMSERDYGTTGMGKDVLSLVLLPWNLVVHPTAFENRTDQIGPLFSLLLPFLLWGAWKVREARFYAGVGLAQVASWFFLAQVSRFLYPALPVLFSAEILGFQNFEKRFPRWGVFAKSLFGILFLALLALSCYRYRYPLRLATGEWTARQFLENLERTTGIADYVNSQLPPTGVKILMAGEVRRYYFDRTIVRERAFGRHTKYSKVFKSPAEVVEFLKRQGITHVLWSDPAGEERKYPKLHIKTLVRDPVISPQFFELMHETKSRNIRDLVYDYALYRIKNTG